MDDIFEDLKSIHSIIIYGKWRQKQDRELTVNDAQQSANLTYFFWFQVATSLSHAIGQSESHRYRTTYKISEGYS